MTVYIDLVFLLNFAVNYLLLRGTARLGAAAVLRGRLVWGAALGAMYAVAVYLPRLHWLSHWPWKLLTALGMFLLSYGLRPSTGRLAAIFTTLSLVLCGAVYGTQALQGRPIVAEGHLFYPVRFSTVLLTALAVNLACLLLLPRLSHGNDSILPVTLEREGNRVHLSALRDSGNTLTDPLSGAPVLTVYWRAARTLLPLPVAQTDFEKPTVLALRLRNCHPRLIPYRAVGVENGLLLALPCLITLGTEQKQGLVAFSPTPLSDGGAYDALTGGITHA